VDDPQNVKLEAEETGDTICISALTGEGLDDFCNAVHEKLKVCISSKCIDSFFWVHDVGTLEI